MRVVVMGVSGCGKSTIGRALAERLGATFRDADDFHPPANIDKMRSGTPLTDADRRPWLDGLNTMVKESGPMVLACSALKQVYRQQLANGVDGLHWVYLRTDFDTIDARMRRREHFMPATLLRSQFDALEEPGEDEALILDASTPVEALVEQAVVGLTKR